MAAAELHEVDAWKGRFYEDFGVGDIYYHPMARTVSTVDNQWFTLLTQNTAKTHLDANFASKTEFGLPLVNSTFILALVTGQSTIDLSFNVYANLGWDAVRLPAPVFEGDTIYSRSTVVALRPSASKPATGVVTVATEGYNQKGVVVIGFRRTFMVYRSGTGPQPAGPRPNEGSLLALFNAGRSEAEQE